eukprot:scaffold5167_cov66-Skeletonema_marinoi.AAC.1
MVIDVMMIVGWLESLARQAERFDHRFDPLVDLIRRRSQIFPLSESRVSTVEEKHGSQRGDGCPCTYHEING